MIPLGLAREMEIRNLDDGRLAIAAGVDRKTINRGRRGARWTCRTAIKVAMALDQIEVHPLLERLAISADGAQTARPGGLPGTDLREPVRLHPDHSALTPAAMLGGREGRLASPPAPSGAGGL